MVLATGITGMSHCRNTIMTRHNINLSLIYNIQRKLIKQQIASQVELVEPPASSKIGERVTFPGYSGEPAGMLNAKSKVWEKVQADLYTNAQLVASYKDVPFTTSAGVCKVRSIPNGEIR